MKFKFLTAIFFVILSLGLEAVLAQGEPISSTVTSTTTDSTNPSADPTSTSADPTSTSADPTTTSADPKSTSADPTATSADPTSTSADPKSTSADPTTTTADPTTTSDSTNPSADPTTTTAEPTTTSADPTTTPTTEAPPSFADDVTASTKNLLGINCMVQAVYNIEDIVPDFEYEIELCGSKVKKDSSEVLNNVKKLQKPIENVNKANKKDCKNENYKPSTDAAKVPSTKCVKKIQDNMEEVNSSVESTLKAVNKNFEQTTSSCARMALLQFRFKLNNFSAIVSNCARLAGKV